MDAPILDAYDDGAQLRVWCVYCKRWHNHGRGPGSDGHRVAHCIEDTPYSACGYVLRTVGTMPRNWPRRKPWAGDST